MTISWDESYFGQLRALAGDRTLLLTAARLVARDAAGRLLLVQRSDNSVWSLPAGCMELGESIADCAARELHEETGLRALQVTPYAMHTGPGYLKRNLYGDMYQHFVVLFRVDRWDGELVRKTDETIDAGFFDETTMPEPISETVAESLADLAEFVSTRAMVLR